MLIDTHAHLFWSSFDGDIEEVVERAKSGGVEQIIVPGTDIESSRKAIELAKRYPDVIRAAVGIHPEEVMTSSGNPKFEMINAKQILNLKKIINENREFIVAIGEIGTDKSSLKLIANSLKQRQLFKEQCEMAVKHDLPVIIHTRESFPETIEALDSLPSMPRGQFHCFSYDEDELAAILERGFFVSFCGNITWSKRLQRVFPLVPLERLLLETDSPFMTPLSLKGKPSFAKATAGKRNEPINVKITATLQANLAGITLDELGAKTTENARQLFDI